MRVLTCCFGENHNRNQKESSLLRNPIRASQQSSHGNKTQTHAQQSTQSVWLNQQQDTKRQSSWTKPANITRSGSKTSIASSPALSWGTTILVFGSRDIVFPVFQTKHPKTLKQTKSWWLYNKNQIFRTSKINQFYQMKDRIETTSWSETRDRRRRFWPKHAPLSRSHDRRRWEWSRRYPEREEPGRDSGRRRVSGSSFWASERLRLIEWSLPAIWPWLGLDLDYG